MPVFPAPSPSQKSSSAVASVLFEPLAAVLPQTSSSYRCHVLRDEVWLTQGVHRCIGLFQSGRDFLQHLSQILPIPLGRSTFFESLKSKRRLRLLGEVNALLQAGMASVVADPFLPLDPEGSLAGFDLFAGDGHFHKAAAHDSSHRLSPKPGQPASRLEAVSKFAVPHFYGMNLRTQGLVHLALGDQIERKKEHDMRALKRMAIDSLRQGAKKGRKVLWVWDRAGIDFRQWHAWKHQSAIYFLSREKTNMTLEIMGEHGWDQELAINAHVLADELMGTSQGVSIRRVTYKDPESQELYTFLTNLPVSVAPGMVALLYRRV